MFLSFGVYAYLDRREKSYVLGARRFLTSVYALQGIRNDSIFYNAGNKFAEFHWQTKLSFNEQASNKKAGLPVIWQPGCLVEIRGFPSPPFDGFGFKTVTKFQYCNARKSISLNFVVRQSATG